MSTLIDEQSRLPTDIVVLIPVRIQLPLDIVGHYDGLKNSFGS